MNTTTNFFSDFTKGLSDYWTTGSAATATAAQGTATATSGSQVSVTAIALPTITAAGPQTAATATNPTPPVATTTTATTLQGTATAATSSQESVTATAKEADTKAGAQTAVNATNPTPIASPTPTIASSTEEDDAGFVNVHTEQSEKKLATDSAVVPTQKSATVDFFALSPQLEGQLKAMIRAQHDASISRLNGKISLLTEGVLKIMDFQAQSFAAINKQMADNAKETFLERRRGDYYSQAHKNALGLGFWSRLHYPYYKECLETGGHADLIKAEYDARSALNEAIAKLKDTEAEYKLSEAQFETAAAKAVPAMTVCARVRILGPQQEIQQLAKLATFSLDLFSKANKKRCENAKLLLTAEWNVALKKKKAENASLLLHEAQLKALNETKAKLQKDYPNGHESINSCQEDIDVKTFDVQVAENAKAAASGKYAEFMSQKATKENQNKTLENREKSKLENKINREIEVAEKEAAAELKIRQEQIEKERVAAPASAATSPAKDVKVDTKDNKS